MKKVFCTSFLRFGKSRLIYILIAAVAVVFLIATAVMISRMGRSPLGSEFDEDSLMYQKTVTETALENPDLTDAERHDLMMSLSKTQYYLATRTGSNDYYLESSSDGGAYWMQVYFLFGGLTAAIAAIILSVWFFPGIKSGVHRTEFLTGRSRSSLWLGKNSAAALTSLVVPALFALITLVCAAVSPEVRFMSEDHIAVEVYSVSALVQWAAQAAGMFAVGLLASALVGIAISLSGDTAVGIAVPLVAVTVCTLGLFFAMNVFVPDNVSPTVWYFVPFLGLTVTSFKDGVTTAYAISLAMHVVLAAACYGVSYATFVRKPL